MNSKSQSVISPKATFWMGSRTILRCLPATWSEVVGRLPQPRTTRTAHGDGNRGDASGIATPHFNNLSWLMMPNHRVEDGCVDGRYPGVLRELHFPGILREYLREIFFLDCLVPIYSYAIRLGIKKAVTHLRGTWDRRIVIGGDHLESHGLEQTG